MALLDLILGLLILYKIVPNSTNKSPTKYKKCSWKYQIYNFSLDINRESNKNEYLLDIFLRKLRQELNKNRK